MAIPQEKYYTIEDIHCLSEDTRAELIDGQIFYMSPSPSRIHQRAIMQISRRIGNYIEEHNGQCEVYPAPFAVYLCDDDKTYLEPDISVICDPSKLDDRGCNGAPDWIIEIISPSNSSHDYIRKLQLYSASGVREYWIVNPQTKHTLVYFFESGILGQPYSFQDKVKVNIYDDFEIDFNLLNI